MEQSKWSKDVPAELNKWYWVMWGPTRGPEPFFIPKYVPASDVVYIPYPFMYYHEPIQPPERPPKEAIDAEEDE